MKFTRVIVAALIATAFGALAAQAQSLRSIPAAAPAEFPPASYAGKQYVDSRGCIFIRAGIDGTVTWVPRVSRAREQICGYKPTFEPGSAAAAATARVSAPTRTPAPVEITLAPSAQPAPRPLPPAVVQSAEPVAPAPVAVRYPAPVPAGPAPRRQAPPVTAAIAPRSVPYQVGPCANASPLSQQYINRGPGVRCGPQQETPFPYGSGWGRQSGLQGYAPGVRVVPRHVYDQRRNTRNVTVPAGYRAVWTDDRLNPHRAEHGLAPAIPLQGVRTPVGYLPVVRDDDRLNPYRGHRTIAGEAQADQIWTRTVPRTLVQLPTDRPVGTVPDDAARSPAEARRTPVLRLSSRSAPEGAAPPVVRTPER